MRRANQFKWVLFWGLMSALSAVSVWSCSSSDSPSNGGCPTGWILCNGICVDITTNPSHCGGCNRICSGVCSGAICSPSGVSGSGGSFTGGSGTTGIATSGSGGTGASSSGITGTSGSSGISGSTGTSGSSGTVATTGGSDAAPVSGGGYITSGSWKGFAWTAAPSGATITPEDLSSQAGFPLCVSGTVEPDSVNYANLAILGWNINQDTGADPPTLEVTPSGSGISISVSNPGASELRLQIQGPNGATDPNDRWCAVISGNGGVIPYSDFNTECWVGGNGTAYSKQPIVAVMVLVPCLATSAVNYDFCINSLQEAP
ncbi:MAG: hypothetical protein JXA30_01195 [Deltaproteobacteria bacterium]|nr:hypothetical protein [Deltaproteobacteria bacterium]